MSHPTTAIKAIFFDFDGVLTTDKIGSQTTIRSLSQSTGLPEAIIRNAFNPHIADLVLGRKTHEQIWPEMCSSLGFHINPVALIEAFGSTPLNQPMLQVAQDLGARYRVGIITDNPSDRMAYISQLHKLNSLFEPIVVSADIGSSKHSDDIFQQALSQIRCKPSESIFVDNTERNLVVAQQLGMHVIHHDDAANDIAKLRESLATTYGLVLASAA